MGLRDDIIKVAQANPETRRHLVPLIRRESSSSTSYDPDKRLIDVVGRVITEYFGPYGRRWTSEHRPVKLIYFFQSDEGKWPNSNSSSVADSFLEISRKNPDGMPGDLQGMLKELHKTLVYQYDRFKDAPQRIDYVRDPNDRFDYCRDCRDWFDEAADDRPYQSISVRWIDTQTGEVQSWAVELASSYRSVWN